MCSRARDAIKTVSDILKLDQLNTNQAQAFHNDEQSDTLPAQTQEAALELGEHEDPVLRGVFEIWEK
jgi:hypothetical protein